MIVLLQSTSIACAAAGRPRTSHIWFVAMMLQIRRLAFWVIIGELIFAWLTGNERLVGRQYKLKCFYAGNLSWKNLKQEDAVAKMSYHGVLTLSSDSHSHKIDHRFSGGLRSLCATALPEGFGNLKQLTGEINRVIDSRFPFSFGLHDWHRCLKMRKLVSRSKKRSKAERLPLLGWWVGDVAMKSVWNKWMVEEDFAPSVLRGVP